MRRCIHNSEYECFTCETARHDLKHPHGDVDGCPVCKYRTINLSASCMPSKTKSLAPPAGSSNAWEQGVATDHRGVPYLDGKLEPIGMKPFGENRRKYEEAIRKNRNTVQSGTP